MNSTSASSNLSNQRIVRFLGVGVLNTLFGYGIYAGLVFFNLPYLIALLMATIAGIVFNYFSLGRMVFKTHAGWLVFGKFILAYIMVYIVNAALLGILTQIFYFNPYIGQGICILPSVTMSWFLMSNWVYEND